MEKCTPTGNLELKKDLLVENSYYCSKEEGSQDVSFNFPWNSTCAPTLWISQRTSPLLPGNSWKGKDELFLKGQINRILSTNGGIAKVITVTLQGINLCPFPHQLSFCPRESCGFCHLVHSKFICAWWIIWCFKNSKNLSSPTDIFPVI